VIYVDGGFNILGLPVAYEEADEKPRAE
jgi:hypothetical protein